MRADRSATALYGGVLIRSRWPTSRPPGKVGKILNPGQQDAPWGDLGETNGERAGVGRSPGATEDPKGTQIYANGNYGFVYHQIYVPFDLSVDVTVDGT